MPDKKYKMIYADPPWRYDRCGGSGAGRHYDTMTVKEICELPVANIVSDIAMLFLWTTNSFLREAFEVVDAWGFEYKTCITWKKNKWGLGYWAWGQTEHCFLCVKGKPDVIKPPLLSTIYEHNATPHSKKPDAFRAIIEKFPLEPRIELFARTENRLFSEHVGWDVWGKEAKDSMGLFNQI